MTGRATTQAISATELTEGDSDTLRMRHQLEALANASHRTPRLVLPTAEGVISVEPSAKAPAAKRSRASSAAKSSAPKRTRAAKATKADDKPEALNDKQEAPDDKQELPDPPPTVSAVPTTMPTAVPAAREYTSRAFALVAALALATVT